MIKDPETLAPSNSLAEASKHIIEAGLYQLPVFEDRSYIDLFTTNSLARWLSAAIVRGDGDLIEEAATVADVLEFAEDHEAGAFVRPTMKVYTVFDALKKGSSPPVVLVTTDAQATGKLQGIVTRFDVPRILKEIATTFR